MGIDIRKELLAAAQDLREASDMRLMTAEEMEKYCPDCAEQIRQGELEMTHGELKELLADERTADKWNTLPEGWTQESLEQYWESLTGDAEHKVTKCIERMKDEDGIDDAGAFCASLADRIEGTTEWRGED